MPKPIAVESVEEFLEIASREGCTTVVVTPYSWHKEDVREKWSMTGTMGDFYYSLEFKAYTKPPIGQQPVVTYLEELFQRRWFVIGLRINRDPMDNWETNVKHVLLAEKRTKDLQSTLPGTVWHLISIFSGRPMEDTEFDSLHSNAAAHGISI